MTARKSPFALIVMLILLPGLLLFNGCAGKPGTKRAGDITIGCRSVGSGYPLIMIMGFRGTMDFWSPDIIEILSSRYTVITFDNRGMGDTTAGTRQFTIEQFADDTAGLMEALGIERAHVLGWSMGTEIAQELALRYPKKVTKLILYAADCSMAAFPPSQDVLDIMSDTSGPPEEQGKRLIGLLFPQMWIKDHVNDIKRIFSRPMGDSPPENIERQGIAMDTWKGSCDRLARIQCPILLITGTDDVLTPPQNSYMMAEKIPGSRLVTIEGGGHGVMYQYPQRFCDAVIDFLK